MVSVCQRGRPSSGAQREHGIDLAVVAREALVELVAAA